MPVHEVIESGEDHRRIADAIDLLPRPLEILEAGCGRRWTLDIQQPYRLTGVDLDGAALDARQERAGDLDVAILGDIRTAELPDASFDVIYSSFVLEHVKGANAALDNFVRWLRPGGLLVVKVPDPSALYGRVARSTPYWFHVLYYRRIKGMRAAGTPGHAPYPTVYDEVINPTGFRDYCDAHGLVVERVHRVDNYIQSSRPLRTLGRLVGLLTLGRVPWRWNDLTYMARKPAAG